MKTPERQPNIESNPQTFQDEVALTKQEIKEFQKLPKKEREKQRDEQLAKLKELQEKLDQAIQEAIKTGDLEEAKRLKEQLENELFDLESLLGANREKLIDIPFDPNNFFTEADWLDLQNLVLSGDGGQCAMPYASLAIIDKNRMPGMPDAAKDRIGEDILESLRRGGLQSVAWANYISPFPEFTKVPDDILQKGIKGANEEMVQCRKSKDWRHFCEPVAWLTVMGYRPELSQDDFDNLEAELKKQQKYGNGGYMIEVGAAISIIYPDYPLEFSKEQSKEMASYVKKSVARRVGCEWYKFAAMAKVVADKLREVEANKELD